MKNYIYYPGCSLKSGSKHYEESLLPVFKEVGAPLNEMEDWNCCGSTAYFSVNDTMASAICGRNLSLAEQAQGDIIAPCAGCYLTMKKSNTFLSSGDEKAKEILKARKDSGCEYKGSVNVRHPVEVLINDIGLDAIRERVRTDLSGLKIACYYGCQLVRPYTDFDTPDYPESLDKLMEAVGAEAIDFSAKTRCCGGSLSGTLEDVGLRLNDIIMREAKRKGADAIVTICPLCLFNLEIMETKLAKKEKEVFDLPILYFSQIMGLAFGLSKDDLGYSRSIIPLKQMWEKIENGGSK